MTMTYNEADRLIRSARNEGAGKPIQNNTRLYRREGRAFAVKLHAVDVVTINADGTYTLRNGGWAHCHYARAHPQLCAGQSHAVL